MRLAILRLFFCGVAMIVWQCRTDADEPRPEAEQAFAYAKLTPVAEKYVLVDDVFPKFEFADRAEAGRILGDYQLEVEFHDAAGPVTKATAPGRYGAVVRITPEPGRKLPISRRFTSLYRLPDRANFEQQSAALVAGLKTLRWNFKDVPGANTAETAQRLAAWHEIPAGDDPSSFYHQPIEKDRQWWIGIKRRLYGYEGQAKYDLPFRGPRRAAKPAPVIRTGTNGQAGVKTDFSKKVDETLARWAEDSPEGFDVCIVRRGITVFEKSYGNYRGQPVTAATKFHLTSTSKFLTGLMLMMCVDRGVLDLDTPITEMPGPLHKVVSQKPLTIRALYTHTAFTDPMGLPPTPDLEERLAIALPHLPIGQGYQYTGTSLELAWALVSTATGQSISTFARDQLLEPLGCRHTEVFNTGGATESTAHDLARVLQMVQNGGSYGDTQFLTSQTVQEMLPRRLTKTLGPYTNDREWGIGAMPWKVSGLSPFTFGHKGYYRSTAFCDPIHELVVVMTRVDPPSGKKYDEHHPRFLHALVDSLTDLLPAFPESLAMVGREVTAGTDRFTLEATVENPGAREAVLEYRYETQGTPWRLEPSTARILLPAGARVAIRVEAILEAGEISPLPKLWGAIYPADRPVPPGQQIEYWVRPLIRRGVVAAYLEQAPKDGVLPGQPIDLLETHGRKPPELPTTFQIARDEKHLYLTVIATESLPPQITAPPRDDAAIRTGEHVELVLQPTADPKSLRRFAVQRSGAQYDALAGDVTWNADWKSTVRPIEGGFVVQFAIPFVALAERSPGPADTWLLNLQRGRGNRPPKWERYAQWVMNYAQFDSVQHLGKLEFGKSPR